MQQTKTNVLISKNAHKLTFNFKNVQIQCNIKCTQNSTINATIHLILKQQRIKVLQIKNISYCANKLNYTIKFYNKNVHIFYNYTQRIINIVLNTLLQIFNNNICNTTIQVNNNILNY